MQEPQAEKAGYEGRWEKHLSVRGPVQSRVWPRACCSGGVSSRTPPEHRWDCLYHRMAKPSTIQRDIGIAH